MGSRMVAGRLVSGGRDERFDLDRRPRNGPRARAHLQPQISLDARLVARRALDCLRRRRWRSHDPAGDRERRDRRKPRAHVRRADLHGPGLLSGRDAPRLRGHEAERKLQRVHPDDRGRSVRGRRDRGDARQRFRARSSLLRQDGHAHHAGLAARRHRAAAGLEPAHAAWLRQRAARARGRERDRQGDDGAGGTDAVSHAAARLARRQALRLLLDPRGGGPVQQRVRAADLGRRALQADLLPARCLSSALVAGRRVDRVHLQRGRPAAAPAARDVRGRAPEDCGDRAPLEAADERPLRADDRRGDRSADRGAHSSHRVGRQALHAGGRVLPGERRRRPAVPPDRIVPRGRAARGRDRRSREGVRVRPGEDDRAGDRGPGRARRPRAARR